MPNKTLTKQIAKYLDLFGEVSTEQMEAIETYSLSAASASERCFAQYASLPKTFNIYQTHHSIYFIYKLAKILYLAGHENISEKLYLANRTINGVDLYYKIDMPETFIVGHGVGTVFSRATYGEYLVVFQNCTIGVSGGRYPDIKDKVVIFPNSTISGKTIIGENCVIGAGSTLINATIPDNSLVFGGGSSKLTIKDNCKNIISDYFSIT